MSAFAGVQGYENLSSAQQKERSAADAFDMGFAQKPSAPPAQLSRVLYIPPHDSSEICLTICNASAEYKHAISYSPLGGSEIIGEPPMGSRLFTTRLSTMKEPGADQARYIFQAKIDVNGAAATLQSKGGDQATRVTINSLKPSTQDFALQMGNDSIRIAASFPIQDTVSSLGTARHPFFAFSLPDGKAMQWQIHPLQSGPLRYDLVELKQDAEYKGANFLPNPESIAAVYHHIGHASSLSTPRSQGVLLLPESEDLGSEAFILASVMGLLWQVRGIEVVPHNEGPARLEKRSILRRVLGKDR